MKYLYFALMCLLTGCVSVATPFKAKLPQGEDWYLGFFAPPYMEVWMERVDVEDVRGLYYSNILAGTTATSGQEAPGGWPQPMQVPMGKGRSITGSALPKLVFVRWQSLVEPQTYRIVLDIPESVREQMTKNMPYQKHPQDLAYQDVLTIELAPGGWIKAWVQSSESTPLEILCQKAEVEPKGPDQGLSDGRYAYALNKLHPETQEYLKTHPIPFNSWTCPEQASVSQ
ncbi:DUF2931 family protein [Dyella caseinilytica]|uniref:DUF2931 family protein n=1 Tax=Dyella caseinilytica TaxID=1849581 RepID=A0ABX7GRX5_9GAMM|nr:DUF2931 family protein [Dyella caseinilytica]QRN52743.1 DUF2931 family protein [Dyella caseinilytica]GGA08369.1 hypothetical protein GCM10011408_32180 [Dyella caseinilytica]